MGSGTFRPVSGMRTSRGDGEGIGVTSLLVSGGLCRGCCGSGPRGNESAGVDDGCSLSDMRGSGEETPLLVLSA